MRTKCKQIIFIVVFLIYPCYLGIPHHFRIALCLSYYTPPLRLFCYLCHALTPKPFVKMALAVADYIRGVQDAHQLIPDVRL